MNTLNLDTSTEKLIENQFGDQYLFSVNQATFDKIDYKSKFKQDFGKVFEEENTLYLISGTDSGMMINHLLENPPEKGSAYIFVEFPEIIELIKDQYDLGEHKRIIVTTEDKWQEKAEKIGMNIYFTINKVRLFKSFASQYNFISEYIELHQHLEKTIEQLKWELQTPLSNIAFIQKQLENVAENHSPSKLLGPFVKGKKALILAGGPSLDNYIEWIEENQSHYIVIAVSRVARVLKKTNINPDIIISVDPHAVNYLVSKEIFHYEKKALLINHYHLSPLLLGNWQGENLYMGSLLPWKCKLNPENHLGVGPTVTHSAIYLAIQLGITEQILLGVDLCYSPTGYSHSKDSEEHKLGPTVVNFGKRRVETNIEGIAETNEAYYHGIEGIEQLILQANNENSDSKFINPSPNSAKIKGVTYCAINDVKVPKDKFSISSFLQTLSDKSYSTIRSKHYKAVLKELNKAHYKIDDVAKKAKKGLKLNESFFKDNEPEKNFKFKIKMDKLEDELNHRSLENFTSLAKKFGTHEFLAFLSPDVDREWTNEEIKKSAEIFYTALKSGADIFSKHIASAINLTESRLLELNHLSVNDELIKRHLQSFNKNITLHKTYLNNDIRNRHLMCADNNFSLDFVQRKQLLTDSIEDFLTKYESHKNQRSETHKKQIITFFIVMLQNGLNLQEARISILEQENPEIYKISDNESFLSSDKDCPDFLSTTALQFKQNHKKLFSIRNAKNMSDFVDSSIAVIERMINNLEKSYDIKDIVSVEKIVSSSKLLHKSYPEVKEFIHLSQGTLLELQEKYDEAIAEYSYANSLKTHEKALRRVVSISLNRSDFETALVVLEALISISPIYLPQLAQLHSLAKNYQTALNYYTKYLDYNPKDLIVLFKVAELYEKQDIFDGAKFIYKEILNIEPKNKLAKESIDRLCVEL